MKRKSIKIDEELTKLLKERKEKTGLPICWQIEEALRKYLKIKNK